jgi:hypothetical protein
MESIPFWLQEILGGAVQALDRGHGNAVATVVGCAAVEQEDRDAPAVT